MPSTNDLTNMQAALDKLQSAQLQAQADVSGSWYTGLGTSLLGDTSSQDAQQTALSATSAMNGNLAGPYWLEVVSGTRSVDSWMGIAASNFSTIQGIDADVGNWTLGGVVSSTASATSTQVVADVKTAAIIGTPLIIGAVVLVLLIEFGPVLFARSA